MAQGSVLEAMTVACSSISSSGSQSMARSNPGPTDRKYPQTRPERSYHEPAARRLATAPTSCTPRTRKLLVRRRPSQYCPRRNISPGSQSAREESHLTVELQPGTLMHIVSGDIDAFGLNNAGPAFLSAFDSPNGSWRLLEFA